MKPIGDLRLGFEKWFSQNPSLIRIAKRYDVSGHPPPGGSRFVTRQLCKSAASGSRERFRVGQFHVQSQCGNRSTSEERRWVQIPLWDLPGSRRPRPSCITAERLSGSPPGGGHVSRSMSRMKRRRLAGLSLIELLVVLMIIAFISALITTSVLSALNQQSQRVCQNNMLTIEAAKDQYLRDNPGATTVPVDAFPPYFRFGIPKCPDGGSYQNLYNLNQQVSCTYHGALQAFPGAPPTP
jgi:Tfp pilus assembly protein PilE